jgi:hypothetical protein
MIGLVDVAKDSGLQFRDGPEHSTSETLPCELVKKALHGVEPGRRCGSEVEGPARMPSERLVQRHDEAQPRCPTHSGFDPVGPARIARPRESSSPLGRSSFCPLEVLGLGINRGPCWNS